MDVRTMITRQHLVQCSVPGCDRDRKAQGLCNRHYQQSRNRGWVDAVAMPKWHPDGPTECTCDRPDPDGLHECRTCRRPHYPPGYVEALRERIAAR